MRLTLPDAFLKEILSGHCTLKKIAGFDVGTKRLQKSFFHNLYLIHVTRIGLSISDYSKTISQPWGTLNRMEPRFSTG